MAKTHDLSAIFDLEDVGQKQTVIKPHEGFLIADSPLRTYEIQNISGTVDLRSSLLAGMAIRSAHPIDGDAKIILPIPEAGTIQGYLLDVNPKSAADAMYSVTLQTENGGSASAVVKTVPSADTLLSGNLSTMIFVDEDGNVTSDAWVIVATHSTITNGSLRRYAILSNGQILSIPKTGVRSVYGTTHQLFNTSGSKTWIKPTGCREIAILLWGAAGGGGDGDTSNAGGAGGGGAFLQLIRDVEDVASISFTLGAAGSGGGSTGSGGAGGSTTFGGFTLSGGDGGQRGGVGSAGGGGGVVSGSDSNYESVVSMNGGKGGNGYKSSAGGGGSGGIPGIAGSNGVSGSIVTGPTCIWPLIVIPEVTSTGGDGGLGSSSAATAGKPGVGPGAGGGGGGAYSNAGGAGTVARCYIIEFYC